MGGRSRRRTAQAADRYYAADVTREVEELCAALDGLRAGLLKKVAGLSDEDARRSTVDSGTNLAGLLQHLTFVESKWFEEDVAGGKARGTRSMQVDLSVSVRDLRAAYRAACERSNEIMAAIGDADVPMKRQTNARNVRAAILAVIEETARHAGHADIIREQIDGQTGR
jgi:uncharacterized damage-inducible protein DinB